MLITSSIKKYQYICPLSFELDMVLITGATGLLGSQLLFDLLEKGVTVRAVRRKDSSLKNINKAFNYYHKPDLTGTVEWVEGDICDPLFLLEACSGISEVYHCAADVSFRVTDKKKMQRINVEGTANVVNACLENNVKRLCHVSSIGALGSYENGVPIDENTPWKSNSPHSFYSETKYRAEQEVWRGIAEGLDAFIVNPSVIISPFQMDGAMGRLIEMIWKGMKYFTTGINAFVDVRDVSSAMIQLMNSEATGERYIISAGNYSYKQIFEIIAKNLNKKPPTIKAGKGLLEAALIASWLRRLFTGKEIDLTPDLIRISSGASLYSSEKFIYKTSHQFIPIEKSISDLCATFLSKNQS
jgi:dihydroflavonol-4-reductase